MEFKEAIEVIGGIKTQLTDFLEVQSVKISELNREVEVGWTNDLKEKAIQLNLGKQEVYRKLLADINNQELNESLLKYGDEILDVAQHLKDMFQKGLIDTSLELTGLYHISC
jgi:hypothetical protein